MPIYAVNTTLYVAAEDEELAEAFHEDFSENFVRQAMDLAGALVGIEAHVGPKTTFDPSEIPDDQAMIGWDPNDPDQLTLIPYRAEVEKRQSDGGAEATLPPVRKSGQTRG